MSTVCQQPFTSNSTFPIESSPAMTFDTPSTSSPALSVSDWSADIVTPALCPVDDVCDDNDDLSLHRDECAEPTKYPGDAFGLNSLGLFTHHDEEVKVKRIDNPTPRLVSGPKLSRVQSHKVVIENVPECLLAVEQSVYVETTEPTPVTKAPKFFLCEDDDSDSDTQSFAETIDLELGTELDSISDLSSIFSHDFACDSTNDFASNVTDHVTDDIITPIPISVEVETPSSEKPTSKPKRFSRTRKVVAQVLRKLHIGKRRS